MDEETMTRLNAKILSPPVITDMLISDAKFPFGVSILLPVERIRPDEVKLRQIDNERVQGLCLSFQVKGQKQSINVRPDGEYYFKVTFGEHRLAAAIILTASGVPIRGFPVGTIMAVVEVIDYHSSVELKLTENAHRNEFLDPYEAGRVLANLLQDKYSGDLGALSESLGKTVPWITERTAVFHTLDPSLRPFIGNKLTVGNVINLAKLDDKKEQLALAQSIIMSRGGNLLKGRTFGGSYGGGWATPRTIVKVKCECKECGNLHWKPDVKVVVDD